jgi:uncharacterized protein
MIFEWDPKKATRNLRRRGISFEEAATTFDDPLYIMFVDEEHSLTEERYITIGFSNQGRLLMVAHTYRDDRIRIISSRKAEPNERRFYEQEL